MITREILHGLIVAAVILGVAAALRYAESLGMADAEARRRAMQVVSGLLLAYYGNLMPKRIGRSGSRRAVARAQSALRVGGWSITLAGLGYAALWAAAPIALADVASVAVVATAMLAAFGYAAWTFVSCRRAAVSPSS